MTDNIALFSMISKDFIPGFKVFVKSLLKSNPWFNLLIILININLRDEDKELCKKYYNNISFVSPKRDNYKHVNWHKTQRHLRSTYYKLDMFSYGDTYKRTVFIDLDTLVLQNIADLFFIERKKVVSGVRCYMRSGDKIVDYINAGVIVLESKLFPKNIYSNIVHYSKRGFPFPEQDTMNLYFNGKVLKNEIEFLPKKYNVEKRMWESRNYSWNWNNVSILHYVSLKPWQKVVKNSHKRDREKYKELENLWHQYNSEVDNG